MSSDPGSTLDKYAAAALRATRDQLQRLVELHDERAQLPVHRVVGRDQARNTRDFDAACAAALDALEVAAPTELRDRYRALHERIAALEARIDAHRHEQLGAPEQGFVRELLGTTRSALGRRIEQAREEISAARTEAERTVDALAEACRAMGLAVSRDEVVFLLASASGDELIALNAALHNVRALAEQFAALVRERGDAVAARRYYGMSLVLLRVAVAAHDRVIGSIAQNYAPRVDELLTANERARAETRGLLARTSTPDAQTALRRNLDAQDVTAEVGALYRRCLDAQRTQLEHARAALVERADVVANTYATAAVAAELVQLMDASVRDLAIVADLHLPPVVAFDNVELQRRFATMTREIRAPRRLPPGG